MNEPMFTAEIIDNTSPRHWHSIGAIVEIRHWYPEKERVETRGRGDDREIIYQSVNVNDIRWIDKPANV